MSIMENGLYDEYSRLLKELAELLKREGRVKLDDLLSWADKHDVGTFTLSMLIEDLVNKGVVTASKAARKIRGVIGEISLPEEVFWGKGEVTESKAKEEVKLEGRRKVVMEPQLKPPPKPKPVAQRRTTKRKRAVKKPLTSSILSFIGEEAVEKEEVVERGVTKEEEVEEPRVEEQELWEFKEREDGILSYTHPVYEKREVTEGEVLEDDLKKAIRYLNTYWSVGEIRLGLDLQALGIRDPARVIRELLRRGYIERHEIGVINATKKLPRIEGDVSLADILS
ncbi:MAG: hypothetical protein DRJ51_05325 [Thermoprotei archaeon]|nr:MAG: hypothetical protein DRJ51_05325 [Thermoprotei archaeon]